MIRTFYQDLLAASALREDALALASRTFELSEFLVKVAAVTEVGASFPHTVTYHASCHGLRELHIHDEPLQLLRQVNGLTLIEMARSEECCGFGGTFAAKFSDISAAMGDSKAESVAATGAEFVTAIDPSCLLHLEGILGKRKAPTRTIHLASILAHEKPPLKKAG
jgi:L-lactate dehydrogenase complex protein LldE